MMETSKFDRGVSKYMQSLTKMQQATDKLVRGSVTVKDAEGNMIKYSTSTAMAGAATEKAGMSVGQMVTKMAALAAAYGVVNKAQEFAVTSFNAARAQNDIKGALIGVVGGLDQYNKLIEAARGSTRGMVSETNLANAGMVLLKSGIAGSAEEVGRLSAAGTALVNTYSAQGASQEKLVRFLLTGNRALMDNFNITQQQINAKQAEITATTGLTGQEAKLAAIKALVIQEGEKLLGSVSDETIQAGQAAAAWDDFTAAFGQVLIAFNQATGLVPGVTGLFQNLTAGAQAWAYTLNEAIPAIQAHYDSLGQQAARAAVAAKSQDELMAAFESGLSDLDAFRQELIANVDSVEEYNSIIYKGSRGSKIFTDQLSLTGKEFAEMKVEVTAQTVALEKNREAAWGALSATGKLAIEQINLAQSAGASSQALAAVTARYQGLANAERTVTAGHSVLETMAQGETLTGPEAERMAELAKTQEKFAKQSATAMTKSFDQAANSLRSTIESVIKPSLSEVWQPAGQEGPIDEWARRVATIATSGFSSEWLQEASKQFGGQSFFAPILQAMQGGDEGALKQAATDLLTKNVTALWDVETIKARVRQQLQEQNLRQQIIDQVQAELAGEGVTVSPETVAAVAGGATQAAGGMAQANQATADMGLTAGTTQTALDNLGLTLDTITNVKIVAFITQTGELQTAMGKLSVGVTTASTEMITALTAAVPKMEGVIKLVDWVSLGASIDRGIAKGISDNELVVMEKLKSMAKEALKQAGDAIGYGSPAAKFVPLGLSVPQGFALGLGQGNGLVQQAYDKLFGIDRSTASIDKLAKYARQQTEHFQENKQFDDSRGELIRKTLENIFKINGDEILKMADPVKELQNRLFAALPGYRGANITADMMRGSAEAFIKAAQAQQPVLAAAFQKMVVDASRKALDLAGSLSDVATAGAQQLNSEIDMLAQLLNTGASEFMLDGQIYSAAQATDLLNQKMQEQADIQDDLLQMQQSQSQLNFLEKQLGLIETINKAGLNPADVLGGADLSTVSGLVGATNAAIQAIIGQVGQDIRAYTPVQGSQTINNRSLNFNMGGVNVNNSMDIGALTSLIQRTVANGFG